MPPVVSFRQLTEQSFVQMKATAKREVTKTTHLHHRDWQERFGNNDLISDASGQPGTAPPLAEATVEKKGHDDMLDDDTKLDGNDPYFDYETKLMDSLDWFVLDQQEGPAVYEVRGWSVIDNPVFPLNEYGLIHPGDGKRVPQRATLLPTRIEVSQGFLDALREAYRVTLTGRRR